MKKKYKRNLVASSSERRADVKEAPRECWCGVSERKHWGCRKEKREKRKESKDTCSNGRGQSTNWF